MFFFTPIPLYFIIWLCASPPRVLRCIPRFRYFGDMTAAART